MRALARLPARTPVVIATALVGAGCAGVALAPAWPAFVAAVFVIGLGFGGLVIGLNQLVAYSAGRRRAALLNALNGAYSAGAVAGPLLVAAFAAAHFSLLYAGGAVLALAMIPGDFGVSGRLPVAQTTSGRAGLVSAVIAAPLAPLQTLPLSK